MSLSESSDEDVSSEETSPPPKRLRPDTDGASSTSSQGSAPDSDDEHVETQPYQHKEVKYNERGEENHSSYNDTASSPSYEEECRPSLGGYSNSDNGDVNTMLSFQNLHNSSFYKTEVVDESLQNKYSHTSQKMMSKMGHKLGKGLGKLQDGRVEPVEAFTQKGRRGLGMKPSQVGKLPEDFKWKPDDSSAAAKEEVYWMPVPPEDTLSADLLEEWLQKGPKKLTIEDETDFVDPTVLKGVLNAKTIFDNLSAEDFRAARFRCNPYETIGSVFFLNRAAVKMANLDAVFDYMFTNPVKQDGRKVLDNKEILYFADVCAGPGGFSEYVLYRLKWKAKGFGFTLKGNCDFKLDDFYAGTPETFDAYYGVKDDGNVFDPDNLESLKKHVLSQTDYMGVHFLMADGGFSVEGKENIQEILSKQLYLCQCLAALMLVRTGGHFVVKLFDVFTRFSVGLVYIMYRCFERVSIHKPVTSRPANSERYLVCKWKKVGTESVENHLFYVNTLLENAGDDDDVTELVAMNVIQEDRGFYDYILNSNNALGDRQIKNLLKISAFNEDKNLQEPNQALMRTECLKLWQIPNQMRKQPERLQPGDMLSKIIASAKITKDANTFKSTILNSPPKYLEKAAEVEKYLSNVYDWYYMYLSGSKGGVDLSIFIGCGGKKVYQLKNNEWKDKVELNLPPMTLLYGEIMTEFKGEGSGQYHSKALHIIDALMLGGDDISHLSLSERITQCTLFCTALQKAPGTSEAQQLPLRCKKLFRMYKLLEEIDDLECRRMKKVKKAVTIRTPEKNNHEKFYTVGSILFIKEIKAPWKAHISKRTNKKFYYRMKSNNTNHSEEDLPESAKLDMVSAYSERVMWPWDDSAIAIYENTASNCITVNQLKDYVLRDLRR